MVDRFMNWGLGPIIVTRTVAADGGALHRFLSGAANQWRLVGGFADVVALQRASGRCDARLRLPLRVRRHASVHVKPSRTRRLMTAELRLGRRTVAWVTWILTPSRGTTEVDVAVQPECRGLVTRLVLLLGGRRWIARRPVMALATLATTSARAAEDRVALPAEVVPALDAYAAQDRPGRRPATQPSITHRLQRARTRGPALADGLRGHARLSRRSAGGRAPRRDRHDERQRQRLLRRLRRAPRPPTVWRVRSAWRSTSCSPAAAMQIPTRDHAHEPRGAQWLSRHPNDRCSATTPRYR